MIEDVRARVLPGGRVALADAAAFLGYRPKTLHEFHRLGKGPVSYKVGGRRFFHLADLEAFRDTGAREAEK